MFCPILINNVSEKLGKNGEKLKEYVAWLRNRIIKMRTDERNPNPNYANLENEFLKEINNIGIGHQGFGGRTTVLAVYRSLRNTHCRSSCGSKHELSCYKT